MNKSVATFALATMAALAFLGGCNKAAENTPKMDAPAAPTAPTAPDKPDAPVAVPPASTTPTAAAPGSAAVGASASVSANGAEARAGDVSVKLPD